MRELTVRIRFISPCLGDLKLQDGTGRFTFQRSPSGQVLFLACWQMSNMLLAAKLLGRHQDEVRKIHWDINVDGQPGPKGWFERHYKSPRSGVDRFSMHEAFLPGDVVSVNCVVPSSISEDDFWRLMTKAGQYKGISPYRPGEFGFYEVDSIRPRRAILDEDDSVQDAIAETHSQRVQ